MTYLSRRTRILHWVLALLIISLWIVGMRIESLPPQERGQLIGPHASLGMLALVLGTIRLINRLGEGFPESIGHQPIFLEWMAKIIHLILLLIPIIMPIAGLLLPYAGGYPISFFNIQLFEGTGVQKPELREIAATIHGLGGFVFIIALVLHVLGALKHHFVDKDNTLTRMLGFGLR